MHVLKYASYITCKNICIHMHNYASIHMICMVHTYISYTYTYIYMHMYVANYVKKLDGPQTLD